MHDRRLLARTAVAGFAALSTALVLAGTAHADPDDGGADINIEVFADPDPYASGDTSISYGIDQGSGATAGSGDVTPGGPNRVQTNVVSPNYNKFALPFGDNHGYIIRPFAYESGLLGSDLQKLVRDVQDDVDRQLLAAATTFAQSLVAQGYENVGFTCRDDYNVDVVSKGFFYDATAEGSCECIFTFDVPPANTEAVKDLPGWISGGVGTAAVEGEARYRDLAAARAAGEYPVITTEF